MRAKLRLYLNSTALWSFIDQCIVSGSTMVVSILLVAYLGINVFGIYSVYWMAVLLIAGFHQALIVMPLYTLYAKMEDLDGYIAALLREQLFFSIVSLLLVWLVFFILNFAPYSVDSFHGFLMGIITAAYTYQDLLRRILFVKSKPVAVILIDLISVGVFPLILVILWFYALVNLTNVLVLILVLKLVSIILGLYLVSPKLTRCVSAKSVRIQHWKSGKFLFASSILQWLSGNAFVLVSGILLGPASIGVLRIAQSILGVVNVFFLFLENRIPIEAARILHNTGSVGFTNYMVKESKRYFLFLLVSLVSLALFQEQITDLFFGEAMKNYQWLIPAYCLLYVFIYAGTMLRFTFRTLDRNNILFYGYVVSAIVGLSCVYPMINWWGVKGAMLGLFFTQISTITTYTYYLKQKT